MGGAVSDPAGGGLDWDSNTLSKCVVTVATGYSADLLKPLVESLREHSDAHLIIAADADSGFEEYYADRNVTIYSGFPRPAGTALILRWPGLKYYLEILNALPTSIGQLLLVDSRDVVFQADPFDGLSQRDLVFFAENNDTTSWTMRTTNGRWAWAMLPGELRKSLKGKPIVNGGVISGTPAGIDRMCRAKLTIALSTMSGPTHDGARQSLDNLIAHSRMAGDCEIIPNHQFVANVYRDTAMVIDTDGAISVQDGRPCPVVHMYDRQPALLDHVNQRYDVHAYDTMVVSQDRSVGKSRAFSGVAHWLKLARIIVAGHA
jgi:hypothetical protein